MVRTGTEGAPAGAALSATSGQHESRAGRGGFALWTMERIPGFKRKEGDMTVAEVEQNAVTASGAAMLDEAERVLHRLVAEDRGFTRLTPDEKAFFASIGWSNGKIRTERQRVSRRLQLEREALTPQRRGQLRKAANEASELAESRLPEITRQINALEREQEGLFGDRDEKVKAADDAESAAAALADVALLPAHLRRRASSIRADIKAKHEPELKRLRSAVTAAERCVSLDIAEKWRTNDAIVRYATEHLPRAVVTVESGNVTERTVDRALWGRHQQEMSEQLPILRERLAEAEQALQDEIDKAMKPLLAE